MEGGSAGARNEDDVSGRSGGAGTNSDASRSVTADPACGSGSPGRADWAGEEDGGPGRPAGAVGGSWELHEKGRGSIRRQGEDSESGLETGGNSDSGGADDDPAGGNASGGGTGAQGGDWGSAKPAGAPGAPGTDPVGGTRGANGLRTLGLNPHASQN